MRQDAKSTEPEVQVQDKPAAVKAETKSAQEKYFRVRFHAKSHPNDPDDVVLSVNGETLVFQRQKPVVIPERFVVCAENARAPQFRQLPNMPRKLVGEVITFPFDKLGEASEAEYLAMKSEGTQAAKAEADNSNGE